MSGLAESSEAVARIAQETQREQLAWAREQWGQQQDVLEQVLGVQMDAMAENQAWARDDRQRYQDIFQPIENDLIEDFTSYDSIERQESEAGKAVADVRTQFQAQRNNAEARLASMGIDPSQVRSAAIDKQSRLAESLGAASVANTRRENVRDKGRALRADAINIGRGLPSQAAQSYGLALQAGSSGVGNLNSTLGTQSNIANGAGQWGNQALAGYGQSGNLQNSQWQNQFNLSNSRNQMMGDIIGTGLGAWATMSSKKTKKNIKAIPDKESLKQVKEGKNYEYEYKDGYGQPMGKHMGTLAEDENPAVRTMVNSPKGKQMGIDLNAKVARLEGAVREMSKKYADGGPVETNEEFHKRHNRAKALASFGGGSMSKAFSKMVSLDQMLNAPDDPTEIDTPVTAPTPQALPALQPPSGMLTDAAPSQMYQYRDGGYVRMYNDGGEVDGPGGPKEDLIPASLSDGEYVIPAEVVRRKGTDFFDKLLEQKGDAIQAHKAKNRYAERDAMIQEIDAAPVTPPSKQGVPLGGNRYGI
jgi:hypothetical protein